MVYALSPSKQVYSLGLRRSLLILIVACCVLVPGIAQTKFFDRDEGWYAQVSREMIESGDRLIPRYLGEVWLGKPPALYWMVLASYRVFGESEWQARLVSVVSMSASALLAGLLGARLFGRRAGMVAGLTFITFGLPIVVGKMLLADALMLVLTLAAVVMHFELADRGVTHLRAALYWLAIGLGVLVKGPATLLFAGGFAIALLCTKNWRGWIGDWRWWLWLPSGLIVALPWYVYLAGQAGDTLAGQLLWYECFARFLGDSHIHNSPPGLCLLVSLAGLLPWTPLVPISLVLAFKQRNNQSAIRLLLIWLVIPWVVVELMRAKLPHYVMPCYVPLAILTARQIIVFFDSDQPWRMRSIHERVPWTLVGLVMVVLGLACFGGGLLARAEPWGWALSVTGMTLVVGFLFASWVRRNRSVRSAWAMAVIATVAFHMVAGFWLLPSREPERLSTQVVRAINEMTRPGDQIYLCGYAEPTLHYYLAEPARGIHRRDLEAELAGANQPVLLAISQRSMERLDEQLRVELMPWLSEKSITGINEANMRTVTVYVGRISLDTLAKLWPLR